MVLPMAIPALLKLKENIAKKEACANITMLPLQTIRVEKKDIVWAEAGKEILIDGQLFDIKEIVETSTTITITGIFDKAETCLQKLSENLTGKEKKDQGILLTEYFKFLSTTYFQNEDTGLSSAMPLSISHANRNIFFYKDSFIKNPLPPPKI